MGRNPILDFPVTLHMSERDFEEEYVETENLSDDPEEDDLSAFDNPLIEKID